MTTIVKDAAQWSGESFAIPGDDIPHWIIQAMGAGNFVIADELTVNTLGGPVVANPTDWVVLGDAGLGVVTNEDFIANYEVTA